MKLANLTFKMSIYVTIRFFFFFFMYWTFVNEFNFWSGRVFFTWKISVDGKAVGQLHQAERLDPGRGKGHEGEVNCLENKCIRFSLTKNKKKNLRKQTCLFRFLCICSEN